MGIPQARDEIARVIDHCRKEENGEHNVEARAAFGEVATRLSAIVSEHMHRKPPVRRGQRDSTKMTPELAASIRAYAEADPTLSQRAIGEHFNVSSGRVSEVLAGKR